MTAVFLILFRYLAKLEKKQGEKLAQGLDKAGRFAYKLRRGLIGESLAVKQG